MEENYYTNQLEEEIYHGEKSSKKEENKKAIEEFLSELVKRKRNDPLEGGLQAMMVILPASFAAKVNEEDGLSSHAREGVNLIKHMSGERKYLTNEAMGKIVLSQKETMQLLMEGIEVRILDGKDHLMVAIYSMNGKYTAFQIETIENLIDSLKKLKDNYKELEVGLHTQSINIEFNDLDENHYETIIQEIESYKNKNLVTRKDEIMKDEYEFDMTPSKEFQKENYEMNMAPSQEFQKDEYEMNMAPSKEFQKDDFEMNMAPSQEFLDINKDSSSDNKSSDIPTGL